MTLRAKGKETGKSIEAAQSLLDQIKDIRQRVDALPVLDTRPEDEILGYDKQA